MTTRDIQREETKKRIYDVAFKLFDEFGYDKVKVSDIAKAANVIIIIKIKKPSLIMDITNLIRC